MIMASVLALSLTIAILILLLMHFYMIFTNMCSVESGSLAPWNPFFDSYDGTYEQNLQGGFYNKSFNFSRKNFYQVFGTKPLYWYLPLATPKEYQVCDGINWKLQKRRG